MCAARERSSERSGEGPVTVEKSIDPVAIIEVLCYDGAAFGSRWVLVCPLVFKTSDRGEEPLRWVRFPHIPANVPQHAAAGRFLCQNGREVTRMGMTGNPHDFLILTLSKFSLFRA